MYLPRVFQVHMPWDSSSDSAFGFRLFVFTTSLRVSLSAFTVHSSFLLTFFSSVCPTVSLQLLFVTIPVDFLFVLLGVVT